MPTCPVCHKETHSMVQSPQILSFCLPFVYRIIRFSYNCVVQ
jgi:hypothetical protein